MKKNNRKFPLMTAAYLKRKKISELEINERVPKLQVPSPASQPFEIEHIINLGWTLCWTIQRIVVVEQKVGTTTLRKFRQQVQVSHFQTAG